MNLDKQFIMVTPSRQVFYFQLRFFQERKSRVDKTLEHRIMFHHFPYLFEKRAPDRLVTSNDKSMRISFPFPFRFLNSPLLTVNRDINLSFDRLITPKINFVKITFLFPFRFLNSPLLTVNRELQLLFCPPYAIPRIISYY